LESAAKQYGVYTMISHITYEIIRDDFETRQLDKITVVGKSEPVIIYELLGKKGDLDSEMKKMLNIYQQGVDSFYGQQWDVAIEALEESEKLEPCKEFSVGNMSPSKKLIEYCNHFKSNPPGDDWDGVIKLTSK
jgi:adenylate cyclase